LPPLPTLQVVDGKFKDDRWINGRWDLSQFAGADGNTDWDKVGPTRFWAFAHYHDCRRVMMLYMMLLYRAGH
jgi:hypothetical protein